MRTLLLPWAVVAVWLSFLAPAVPAHESSTNFSIDAFLSSYCLDCHSGSDTDSDFRIDHLSRDWSSGRDAAQWAEVLEKVSSGQMPPDDEPRPSPEQATSMVAWLAEQLSLGRQARLAQRQQVSFNKLSQIEYVNTIRQLLGVNFDAADPGGLAEDDLWRGFTRLGAIHSLSPAHVEKYLHAADTILTEAFPDQPPKKFFKHKHALELRGSAADISQPWADRVRVDMWPGHQLQGGRPGPGQALPASGDYRVRIKLSGLKPPGGPAPHLALYSTDLDRMLFEQDIVAPEDQPIIVEFTTHLPAGSINLSLSNATAGPSVLPRSGRADPRLPFFSLAEGRRPWQLKLTDEAGQPLVPFLILDWMEWEGPLLDDGPTFAQREYLPSDRSALRDSLEKFVTRAFRRPCTTEEVTRLEQLVDDQMASGQSLSAAFKTALQAVLCSPDFLYLVEGSVEHPQMELNSWELASRLSYFLWSSPPDEELLIAARYGLLLNSETLREQVQRMLSDPRIEHFVQQFPFQWLQLDKVGQFPPDKKLYPEYDSSLEKSMLQEPVAYFGEVLRNDLSLHEMLISDWAMLNARLAQHYQLPSPDSPGFVRVPLPVTAHRGGLLTQAAVLSLTSDGTRHRPVHRGKWLLETILGQSPPPPPANVPAIDPTPAEQPKATLRDKLAAHREHAQCAGCHARIDPYGLAFDNYDAIGRWRTQEHLPDGRGDDPPVDASGQLIDGRRFSGVEEFKQLLVEDIDRFQLAFIEQLATFATRRVMTYDDRATLTDLAAAGRQADYRLKAIVEGLVLSALFRKR